MYNITRNIYKNVTKLSTNERRQKFSFQYHFQDTVFKLINMLFSQCIPYTSKICSLNSLSIVQLECQRFTKPYQTVLNSANIAVPIWKQAFLIILTTFTRYIFPRNQRTWNKPEFFRTDIPVQKCLVGNAFKNGLKVLLLEKILFSTFQFSLFQKCVFLLLKYLSIPHFSVKKIKYIK